VANNAAHLRAASSFQIGVFGIKPDTGAGLAATTLDFQPAVTTV
jgi:hypothetical protein